MHVKMQEFIRNNEVMQVHIVKNVGIRIVGKSTGENYMIHVDNVHAIYVSPDALTMAIVIKRDRYVSIKFYDLNKMVELTLSDRVYCTTGDPDVIGADDPSITYGHFLDNDSFQVNTHQCYTCNHSGKRYEEIHSPDAGMNFEWTVVATMVCRRVGNQMVLD